MNELGGVNIGGIHPSIYDGWLQMTSDNMLLHHIYIYNENDKHIPNPDSPPHTEINKQPIDNISTPSL